MMKNETGLGGLLERGGVHYSATGKTVRDVLTALIEKVPLPAGVSAETLLQAVTEREALMSTGIGAGIAIPHPRNPVTTAPEEQFAALAFLEKPVDWKALDAVPVHTVLLVVSASAKFHLQTLSEITFFCQQDEFLKLLGERASSEAIIRYIKDTEQTW
jgi:PTS system nitrogen regulatory IIA component